jgi:hypothetical protein
MLPLVWVFLQAAKIIGTHASGGTAVSLCCMVQASMCQQCFHRLPEGLPSQLTTSQVMLVGSANLRADTKLFMELWWLQAVGDWRHD